MTAKHKPATALPWHPDLNRIYADGDKAPQIAYCPKDSEGRHGIKRSESENNAAYIVHAANAYPKLVEALRSMIDAHSDITEGNLQSGAPARVAVKRDARALLRELGEAE